MLTKEQANEILCYVADAILSPMAHTDISASEYWEQVIGEPFSKLCGIVNKYTEKEPPKPQSRNQQHGSIGGMMVRMMIESIEKGY